MTRHLHDEHDDSIYERLTHLDPVGHDTPPAVGSPRYLNIKENAMQTITRPDQAPTPVTKQPTPNHRRSRVTLGVAAAAAALLAGAVLVIDPGGSKPVEALVLDAAENLAEYDSFRATLVRDQLDGSHYEGTGEFDGDSFRSDFVETDANGSAVHTEGLTIIGDTIWTEQNGEVSVEQTGPNDRLSRFPEASQAVINAALTGADVTELGTETIRGKDAERFEIVQTAESKAALSSLTPFELAWFELEYPDAVTQIDVWIADDVIQQITVVDPSYGTTTTTFYDFGADIDITPPTN